MYFHSEMPYEDDHSVHLDTVMKQKHFSISVKPYYMVMYNVADPNIGVIIHPWHCPIVATFKCPVAAYFGHICRHSKYAIWPWANMTRSKQTFSVLTRPGAVFLGRVRASNRLAIGNQCPCHEDIYRSNLTFLLGAYLLCFFFLFVYSCYLSTECTLNEWSTDGKTLCRMLQWCQISVKGSCTIK